MNSMEYLIRYIIISAPVFLVLILLEHAYINFKKLKTYKYRLNDAITNLSTFIFQQLGTLFTKSLLIGIYAALFQSYHLFNISTTSILGWVICLFAFDFCFYWAHRLSHEINFLWASHIAHHQSEEYNLTVALRQSIFQNIFNSLFFLPLAIVGFPPAMFFTITAIDIIYQFFIHTETVKKLGPLEWILNTPSHHRVHHGCNPKYIDRNHAGMFIIWDRLFGTFEPEGEKAIYGITKPLKSWNPIWANVHYFFEMGAVARKTKALKDKIKIWFSNPAWRPSDVPHPDPAKAPLKGFKYNAHTTKNVNIYIIFQFVLVFLAFLYILARFDLHSNFARIVIVGYIAWTLINLGGLFEARRWVLPSEFVRIFVCSTFFVVLFHGYPSFGLVALIFFMLAMGTVIWFARLRREVAPCHDSELEVDTHYSKQGR